MIQATAHSVDVGTSQPNGSIQHEKLAAPLTGLKTILTSNAASRGDRFRIAANQSQLFLPLENKVLTVKLPINENATNELASVGDESLIESIYSFGEEVFILKSTLKNELSHSFFVSKASNKLLFTPIDEGFKICEEYMGVTYCQRLTLSRMAKRGNLIYTNAGGATNVLVSSNGGKSWKAVLGEVKNAVCYLQEFTIFSDKLLTGGECPLDSAYLRLYQLNADGSALKSPEPISEVGVELLSNRMINHLGHDESAGVSFAGAEGAILRSTDKGVHWNYVLKFDGADSKYPYIQDVATIDKQGGTVVAAGFAKTELGGYLGYSLDRGVTWQDVTHFFPLTKQEMGSLAVSNFASTPNGKVYLWWSYRQQDGQVKYRLSELLFE